MQPPFAAPRLGRYPSILLSILGLIIFGFGTAFVNSFEQYLFFRFGAFQALTGYSISSVALSEAGLSGSVGTGSSGECVPVGRAAPWNQSRWEWRKEPPLQAAWRCGEPVPRVPFHPQPPSNRLAPHTFLSCPLTPCTWLIFIEP